MAKAIGTNATKVSFMAKAIGINATKVLMAKAIGIKAKN